MAAPSRGTSARPVQSLYAPTGRSRDPPGVRRRSGGPDGTSAFAAGSTPSSVSNSPVVNVYAAGRALGSIGWGLGPASTPAKSKLASRADTKGSQRPGLKDPSNAAAGYGQPVVTPGAGR